MRAAVCEELDKPLSIENVTPDQPGPRDIVVRLGASGVCHSDLSVIDGTIRLRKPAILGHEGAGLVDWVGSEVTRLGVGDRVIAAFVPSCGACRYCVAGKSQLCEGFAALSRRPRATRADGTKLQPMTGLGTFAEAMICDEMSLVKVDSDLPDEQLALMGCGVTTGVGAALNTAGVEPGSTVAVVGCGGVGQSIIQGARLAGAGQIIAIDPVALKRDMAVRLGASDVVDPEAGPVLDQVKTLTRGLGVDYAFEAIGNPATVRLAFDLVTQGGACVVVGIPRSDVEFTFPSETMMFGEKRVLPSFFGSSQVRRDFPRLVRLAEQGRLKLDDMVSRRIGLDDVNDAFDAMRSGEVIRSVIVY
jgi:S-(hydroxymethyl)glutathione dehydrogenase / alcohol dehydrogenase